MAFRMKHWIGVTAVGLALVMIWRLPLDSPPLRQGQAVSAESIRHGALNIEVRLTAEALRRVVWADSLTQLVADEHVDGVLVAAPELGEVAETQVGRLTEKIRNEIREVVGEEPQMLFGYVLQPHDHGWTSDMPNAARGRVETYVGNEAGEDFCLQLRVEDRRYLASALAKETIDQDRAHPRTGTLGICRFYLAYGPPGDAVDAWLRRGGARFTQELGGPEQRTPRRLLTFEGRRTLLGINITRASDAPIEGDRCLAGHADACRSLFLNPTLTDQLLGGDVEVAAGTPALAIGSQPFFQSIAIDEEFLFDDLQREFGSDAVAEFWTSELEVADAFENAFGIELGAWLVSWVDRVLGVDPPGPGLPRSASSGSMLTIALLLGLAYARNRRREGPAA